MFTFCDVSHDAKQKSINKLESAQYGLEISFKEPQVKGNLFDCSEIWTVARLTYKKQKRVCEFFIL